MFSIDGLASGLDTTSIIDGLISIQQGQLDNLNFRKQKIQTKQASFKGIEAQLIALQGNLRSLGSSVTNLFAAKSATSSDESLITASAGTDALTGTFTVQVDQLARAQQIATQQFNHAESAITQGTLSIRVGNRAATEITIDDQNNTVAGLVDSINNSGSDVSAALITDPNGVRVLLTSNHTGVDNQITVDNQLGSGSQQPDFSDSLVQAPSDAQISIGSGAGAITATSATNVFDNVFQGVTLNVGKADPANPVTITVSPETESAKEAIETLVSSFNDVMGYIDSQASFNAESEVAGPLLGFRPANLVQRELRDEVARILPNLGNSANRLSAIGITFDDQGKLQIESAKLDAALAGEISGVGLNDIRKIFALTGELTNPNLRFVAGSDHTQGSADPYQVVVTQAAERAGLIGSLESGSIVIDNSNNQLSIDIDGVNTGLLTLTDGTYTGNELAAHLQQVINQSGELSGQQVLVTHDSGQLTVESASYGTKSSLKVIEGSALDTLGLTAGDEDAGVNVAGYFTADGQTETATGKGRILTGDFDNENTSGIQLFVSLNSTHLAGGPVTDSMTVTRGIASQLNLKIDQLLDADQGIMENANSSFDQQLESIDFSIDRTQSIFEARRDQLVSDFQALETSISQIQNISLFLNSQLSTSSVGGLLG